MSKTAVIVWCALIGALTGLYAVVWSNLPTVNGYMWIAFIAKLFPVPSGNAAAEGSDQEPGEIT